MPVHFLPMSCASVFQEPGALVCVTRVGSSGGQGDAFGPRTGRLVLIHANGAQAEYDLSMHTINALVVAFEKYAADNEETTADERHT